MQKLFTKLKQIIINLLFFKTNQFYCKKIINSTNEKYIIIYDYTLDETYELKECAIAIKLNNYKYILKRKTEIYDKIMFQPYEKIKILGIINITLPVKIKEIFPNNKYKQYPAYFITEKQCKIFLFQTALKRNIKIHDVIIYTINNIKEKFL